LETEVTEKQASYFNDIRAFWGYCEELGTGGGPIDMNAMLNGMYRASEFYEQHQHKYNKDQLVFQFLKWFYDKKDFKKVKVIYNAFKRKA